MLVVLNKFVINLDRVYSFWKSDDFDDGSNINKPGFYIKFNDSHGSKIFDPELTCVPFATKELRDTSFRDILFAKAEGKTVFAVTTKEEEKKE